MLKPELYTLSQLLNERLFSIPEYQRAYSWEEKQIKALFSDIENVYEHKRSEHFMATLVCLKHKEKENLGSTTEYTIYDIVDGQQRITTLLILLKAIYLKLEDNTEDKNELGRILVKSDKHTTPILKMNHDKHEIFSEWLRKGTINNTDDDIQRLSDRLLKNSIQLCQEFVDKWINKNNAKILDLYALLKNKLSFILHTIDDESVVYRTFEVLNFRGLPVEWLDRLKCMMMGLLYEKTATKSQIESMHKIWSSIYDELGENKEFGSMAIRYLATLKDTTSRFLKEEDSVLYLMKKSEGKSSNAIEIARELKKYISKLKELEINNSIRFLIRIQQPRFLALCIWLSNYTHDQKEELIAEWEKSTFKIYGLEQKDARFKVGDFIVIGRNIIKGVIKYKDAIKQIQKLSEDCNIEQAIKFLKKSNLYETWDEELKYLFYKRELYLAEKARKTKQIQKKTWNAILTSPVKDTIEHIFPKADTEHCVDSFDAEKNDKIYKHRLGNLLILEASKNSSLQDKKPDEKKDAYRDLFIEREVSDLIKKKGWNKVTIKERENDLFNWIKKQWG